MLKLDKWIKVVLTGHKGVVAILNSTSSTYVHMKNSNIEVDQIKVIFLKL